MIAFSSTPIFKTIEYDPPSIFNNGPGGLSVYAFGTHFRRGLNIIYSFSELNYYINPSKYALLIAGPDKDLTNIYYVTEWIKKGGILILLDEYDHSLNLLRHFEFDFGTLYSIKSMAECELDNLNLTIYINVFREIKTPVNSSIICRYNNVPIAAVISYGEGKFVVVGDSSLTINEIFMKVPQWYLMNMMFIDMLIDGRELILYEGARVYREETSFIILHYISLLPDLASNLIIFLFDQPIAIRTVCILFLSLILTVYTMYRYGYPRKHSTEYKMDLTQHEYVYRDLKEKAVKGIELWRKTLE